MNIPYPTDSEIHAAAANICKQALPKRITVRSFLCDMYRNLGLRYIYLGTYDSIAVSFGVYLLAGAYMARELYVRRQEWTLAYHSVFAFAPLLFMLLYGLSFWKEHSAGTLEIKMSCKYTVHHLLAYRMLIASLTGFLCTTVYVILLSILLNLEVFKLLLIAYASMFLFSVVLLKTSLRWNSKKATVGLIGGWVLLNSLVGRLFPMVFAAFLEIVPTVLWVVLDALLIAAMIRQFQLTVRRVYHAYS